MMKSVRRYITLLILFLIGFAGIFFFFYHFGHKDDIALTEFSIAYTNYDQAISDISTADFYSGFKDTPTADEAVLTLTTLLQNLL